MDRALLVANPAASGFTGGLHRTVVRLLSRRYDVETVWPTSPASTRDVLSAEVGAGLGLAVAMGGDGLVHHVAQSVAGTPTPLGIVPVGTTNVFARLLGVPSRPAAAARLLAGESRVSSEPTFALSGKREAETVDRRVLFALGAGADAAVVEAAEKEPYRKQGFGRLGFHYANTAVSMIRSELRDAEPTLDIQSGERRGVGIGAMLQLREVYTYFGPFALRFTGTPPSPITVLVVRQLRLRRGPAVVRRAIGRSGLGGMRGFDVWEGCDRVTVEAAEPVPVHADGEIVGRLTQLEVHPAEERVSVVVPQRRDTSSS